MSRQLRPVRRPATAERMAHRSFVRGWAAGVIAVGVVWAVTTPMVGDLTGELGFAAAAAAWRLGTPRPRPADGVAGLFALAGAIAFLTLPPGFGAWALLALGAGLTPALWPGPPARAHLLLWPLATVLATLGLYAAGVVDSWARAAGWPGPLVAGLTAATVAAFVGLGHAPRLFASTLQTSSRRIPWPSPHGLAVTSDGEVSRLLERARRAHTDVLVEAARADAPVAARVEEALPTLMQRLEDQARDVAELGQTVNALAARTHEQRRLIEARSTRTRDVEAVAMFRDLIAGTDVDLRRIDEIRGTHERALARLHASVVRLERLHVALLHMRTTASEPETTPDLELDALEIELDATAELWAETNPLRREAARGEGAV